MVVTFAFRAKSLSVGVGADEFSLLAMAGAILEGKFPYAEFWDVRPPLAYLWGLPSAYLQDTVTAIKALRLLALLAQGVAAWIFFCLFRRQLGSLAAALGVVALLASANMAALHHLAVPNTLRWPCRWGHSHVRWKDFGATGERCISRRPCWRGYCRG